MTDLIERLRAHAALHRGLGFDDDDEQAQWARDLLTAAEEIERLTASLKRANETAEHFERHWYLRGDEIERLTAALETERMRLAACGVVALANTEQSAAKEREMLPEYRSASLADVERAVDREMQLRAERDELRDVLLRNGFVPCDIPACNCGSWHHRYGLPERMQEIKDALAEAGHELSNANGHLPINALKALVAERDELRRQLAEAEQDARRYRWLRNEANTARKCDPMVCIYPLDEQDLIDGDRLDVAIDAAMDLTRPAEE